MDDDIPTVEALYDKLKGYVRWLASKRSSPSNVLMSAQELEGELNAEIVFGFMYYQGRVGGMDEMVKVVKRMLHNRVGELVHRFYGTHRSAEKGMRSLEESGGTMSDIFSHGDDVDLLADTIPEPQPGPLDQTIANESLAEFWGMLDDDERRMVSAVIYPDRRMRAQIRLRSWRRSHVFQRCTVTLDCALVAEALHMDIDYAKVIWRSIRQKWRESHND